MKISEFWESPWQIPLYPLKSSQNSIWLFFIYFGSTLGFIGYLYCNRREGGPIYWYSLFFLLLLRLFQVKYLMLLKMLADCCVEERSDVVGISNECWPNDAPKLGGYALNESWVEVWVFEVGGRLVPKELSKG